MHNQAAAYRYLDDLRHDIIFSLAAPDGTITYLSSAFERITGWPASAWLGRPFADLVYADDLPIVWEMFQQLLRDVKLPPYTVRVRTPAGAYLLLEAGTTLQVEAGRVVGLLGIARDITSRQRPPVLSARDSAPPAAAARQDEETGGYPALLAAAQRQAQELALLDRVRSAVTRELDRTRVFRTVVEAIAATFGYTQVSLYLIEDETLLLQHQVGYANVPDRIPLTTGIIGQGRPHPADPDPGRS